MKYRFLCISMLLLMNFCASAKPQTFVLTSPDQQITVTVKTSDRLSYSVRHKNPCP
ncbi:MAG: hypothetical protein ACTTKO_05825 [Candidatus Limimorpha sp.]